MAHYDTASYAIIDTQAGYAIFIDDMITPLLSLYYWLSAGYASERPLRYADIR